ncbi:uncharacterized protein LOC131617665 [Vicia villosa]|uniref:uncharacterized protein LOC131617665 n=1 Tax=Vicia villosa TaxID=3911 RepID=UPI00273BEEF6|nr:uncharacterized protein LOC131617665 [Vicia villosa]
MLIVFLFSKRVSVVAKMNIKSLISLFSYAILLISIVAIEPYEDEKKYGEIEKSERNIEQGDGGYKHNVACSDEIVIDNGGNIPLFPDCEKEGGMGHEGGSGKGGCAGGEGGDAKVGGKGKGSCGGGPPDITFPGSRNGGGSERVISIHNSRKMGSNWGHKSYMGKTFVKN